MELVRHPSIEVAVRTALDGADPPAIELITGRHKVLLAKAAPVRALNGAVELVVMVFHDLTEIRRTEKNEKGLRRKRVSRIQDAAHFDSWLRGNSYQY